MTESKTECQLLEEISTKLDKVAGVLVIAGREQGEQIRILRGQNFEWGDIGTMVGLTADAARMRFNSLTNEVRKDKKIKQHRKGAV